MFKKIYKIFIFLIIPAIFLSRSSEIYSFFQGATFENRKNAYVNDQGRKWGDGDLMRAVWAWLEGERLGLPDPMINGKTRKQLITEAIDYITGPGWSTGANPGPNPAGRMYYQYFQDPATRVISDADGVKLRNALEYTGTLDFSPYWCAIANWQFPNLIGAYLSAARIRNPGMMTYDGTCPSSFSYNGHTYTFGSRYDAKTLMRDYLEFKMDDWLRS